MTESAAPSAPTDGAWLAAASCTTGWLDWMHRNLWVASDGLARVPLGWLTTLFHGTRNIDPAKHRHVGISTSDLLSLRQSPSTLWIAADQIGQGSLHRGLANDRLSVRMKD